MSKITGYRELTPSEVGAINEIKKFAAEIEFMIDALAAVGTYDQRWVSIARTHLQQGFMAAVRAVAQPTGF